MSLVAYDSSDDSDRDDATNTGGLFPVLPAPRRAAVGSNRSQTSVPQRTSADLPRAKKRTEPVKITAPEIRPADSDSDDEEPVRKKSSKGTGGLSSLLPQPKNLMVKETQRHLVPHTLTKRPGSVPSKGSASKPQIVSGTSPSPSAIKAAAKSAALQLARQKMATEDDCSDDDLAPENYFSLPESSAQPVVLQTPVCQDFLSPILHTPTGVENAPLDFDPSAESHRVSAGGMQDYPRKDYQYQYPEQPEVSSENYYGQGYYQDPNPEAPEKDESASSSMFEDEAFRRLLGKQSRGKEEIKFLEIKGDDQLSGNKQWMTKNVTADLEPRKSFSKKKGEQPTGQQRRKHQITYLIHQAKEREMELKNSWAENKMTRRQTQAKYGF